MPELPNGDAISLEENTDKPLPDISDDIGKCISRFVTGISAVKSSLGTSTKAVIERIKGSTDDAYKFMQIYGYDTEKKSSANLHIPVEKLDSLISLTNEIDISSQTLKIVQEDHLLVLISKWDEYFGNILRWIFKNKPEIISNSERHLSFSQISKLSSIEEARNIIAESEIESVIRESHFEQFSYLEKKLGIKLREGLSIWPQFIEITQRRNIIAHAGGRISSQYLDVCRQHGVDLSQKLVTGKRVSVSISYISRSCDCLMELGVKLGQAVWRKLSKDGFEESDSRHIGITYDLIKNRQYNVAIKLLEFFLSPPIRQHSERNKLLATINLAQAYKWSGDEASCLKIINGRDWTACSEDFLLAVSVLTDKFTDAASMMKKIGKDGSIKKEYYDTWPLFQKFRESPEFLQSYFDVFGSRDANYNPNLQISQNSEEIEPNRQIVDLTVASQSADPSGQAEKLGG
ncbi:hypothetical protein KXS07_30820 [Inquilinus limosus]|uniref:hypothetical protein n=1 Tax=Inquilinus limosus TaxID=171674 RepID=UPI003F165A3E